MLLDAVTRSAARSRAGFLESDISYSPQIFSRDRTCTVSSYQIPFFQILSWIAQWIFLSSDFLAFLFDKLTRGIKIRNEFAGVTIFRGIHALDGDKPNTPNSDVYYAIVKGNEQGKFSLESGHRTALILRKPVDYDSGDREFTLVITATVSNDVPENV